MSSTAPKSPPSVDKSRTRVRKMFGEIAPHYDLLNNALSFGLAKRWRRRAVREILARLDVDALARNGVLETLDVATGTGDVIIELQRQWRRRGKNRSAAKLRPIGADFAPEMLELARRKAPGVEFVEADGMTLPFSEDRFAIVTNSFGLRNMEDPEKGVAEMARVCRPGGIVAILEFAPPKFPIFAPIFRFYFHRILPRIGKAVAKDSTDAYAYLPQSVDVFASSSEVLDCMRRAGVENPVRIPLTFGVLGLFIGRKTQ